MAVDVTTEPTFRLSSAPRMLFENTGSGAGWDIHPDGTRFVMAAALEGVDPATGGAPVEVYLVTNWFTELRERMGEN